MYFHNTKFYECPECRYEYRGQEANIYNHWLKGYRRGECPGCNKIFELDVSPEKVRADRIAMRGALSSIIVLVGIFAFLDDYPLLLLLLIPTVPTWLYGIYLGLKSGVPELRRVKISWREND